MPHVVLICSLFVNNLMPMVTIAPDCIIAAGSVVTKSCLTLWLSIWRGACKIAKEFELRVDTCIAWELCFFCEGLL